MTKSQEVQQTEGPRRPTIREMLKLLEKVPAHHEVRAIAINGQTGAIWVDVRYEDMEQTLRFEEVPYGDGKDRWWKRGLP